MPDSPDRLYVYISRKWETIYDVLCRGDGVFDQIGALFTLCATIGHLTQSAKPLDNKKAKTRWINLDAEREKAVLATIAWDSQNRDLSVLADNKKILDLACEFAEGGMQYLYDNFFEDYMQDGQLIGHKKFDIELNLAQIVEGLRQQQSVF